MADAGRLDLTVEALVAGKFRDQFSAGAVEAAQARLSEYGFQPEPVDSEQDLTSLAPGSTFTVEVQVGEGGALTLRLP